MNPYVVLGTGVGTSEAASLSTRMAAWHDAMVAHERALRARRNGVACDDECPHAEARTLWAEAVAIHGDRARELGFLRSRAEAADGTRGHIPRNRRNHGEEKNDADERCETFRHGHPDGRGHRNGAGRVFQMAHPIAEPDPG